MFTRYLKVGVAYKVVEVKEERDGSLLHRKVFVERTGAYVCDVKGFVLAPLWLESGVQIRIHSGVRLKTVPTRRRCYCSGLTFPHRPGTTGCNSEEAADEGR